MVPAAAARVAAFREALDEKLDLAVRLADAFEEDPNVDLCWRPQLTVVPFRLASDGAPSDPDAPDDREIARQKALLDRINAGKRVFLSSTMIHGRKVLRACFVSHRRQADRIDECIEIVREAAARAARGLWRSTCRRCPRCRRSLSGSTRCSPARRSRASTRCSSRR